MLALLKLVAAVKTGSLAVLSSLIDSMADIVASAITFVSVQISQLPPDRGHRYGHGKAENLSALAQATLVAGTAVFVLIDAAAEAGQPRAGSLDHAGHHRDGVRDRRDPVAGGVPEPRYQPDRLPAIRADSLHYRADLLTNLSIIASLILIHRLEWLWLDPLMGATIALYLAWNAYRIGQGRGACADGPRAAADDPPAHQGHRVGPSGGAGLAVVDLRTREAGNTQFIELHVEIDGTMSIGDAHDVTDAIEAELFAAFPAAEVILHQEPAGVEDARLDHRIARTPPQVG